MRQDRMRITTVLAAVFVLLAACEAPPTPVMEFKLGDDAATVVPTAGVPDATSEAAPPPAAAKLLPSPIEASTSPAMPATWTNPVLDRDFPDPDVVRVGDTYYAYSTNQIEQGKRVQVARSRDLVDWEYLGEALPQLPSWASQGFGFTWAPDVSLIGQQYLMYYTTRFAVRQGGVQCIGIATSHQPQGPFTPSLDVPQPFVCEELHNESVDASTFRDTDGKLYLLWQSDANSVGGIPWIYIQELSEDGLTRLGQPTRLISVTQVWEGVVVEGPTLWRRNNKYYLFYSASDHRSPRYVVGVAEADSVFGPYTKRKEPLLKTTLAKGIIGPGGQDVVEGPDGETYMLFHAWNRDALRTLNLARLRWVDDHPVVELPDVAVSDR